MNFLHKFRGYFRLDDLKRTRYPRRVLYKLLSVPLLITLILTIYLFNRSKVDVEFERATRQCHAPYYDVLKEDGEEKVISRQNKILSERLQNCSFLEGRTPLIYSPERQDWTFPMDKESDMLLELIRCNVPFAFTRWGDGEHMLLQGKTIVDGSQAKALDNWQWTENRVGVLAQDLIESLGNTVGLYFHGFPCPLPWTKSLKNFMAWAKKTPTSRMSYSTVWIGENYNKMYQFYESIQDGKSGLTQKVVLVVNQSGRKDLDILSTWTSHVVFVPDNCAELFEIPQARCAWISYIQSMARLHDNTLFMVSAGPLSEALIYNMYIANPYSNQYIDFGSSLDVFGKRNNTRWYTPRVSTQHACPFAYGRDLKEGNNKDNRGLLMKQVYEPTPAQLAEYEEEKKSGN